MENKPTIDISLVSKVMFSNISYNFEHRILIICTTNISYLQFILFSLKIVRTSISYLQFIMFPLEIVCTSMYICKQDIENIEYKCNRQYTIVNIVSQRQWYQDIVNIVSQNKYQHQQSMVYRILQIILICKHFIHINMLGTHMYDITP